MSKARASNGEATTKIIDPRLERRTKNAPGVMSFMVDRCLVWGLEANGVLLNDITNLSGDKGESEVLG